MKFPWIQRLSAHYPVRMVCRVLGVSSSGYYAWKQRPACARQREDLRLRTHIRAIFEDNDRAYGSPRIHQELRDRGLRCGRKRVGRLMRQDQLRPKQVKPFRVTTDSKHGLPVAANLLGRQFQVHVPNTVWLGDITYLRTRQGWLYLAVLMDLASRRIVGWSMSSRITQELTRSALCMAVQARRPGAGLVHHTDRGSQYAAADYQKLLSNYRMRCSMSRRGNCWDNAPMESFFHSLKVERVHHRDYRTRAEARSDVFDYIERFYNQRRKHSALGYRSPAEYEQHQLWKTCGNLAENSAPDLNPTLHLESNPLREDDDYSSRRI